MEHSDHSIIGCHYDGYGVAITLVESFGEDRYHILENWHKSEPAARFQVVDKCDELFHQEKAKQKRKIEIFINNSLVLETVLNEVLKVCPSPVKIASILADEAFTLINSLFAEQKISLSQHTLSLKKDLRRYDPLLINQNHQIHSIFNSVAQAEFNRITIPKPHYSVSGRFKRGSHYTFLSDSDWDD